MDTIFMDSGNSKTSDRNILLLNLPDKILLRRSDKFVAVSNLTNRKYKNRKIQK